MSENRETLICGACGAQVAPEVRLLDHVRACFDVPKARLGHALSCGCTSITWWMETGAHGVAEFQCQRHAPGALAAVRDDVPAAVPPRESRHLLAIPISAEEWEALLDTVAFAFGGGVCDGVSTLPDRARAVLARFRPEGDPDAH